MAAGDDDDKLILQKIFRAYHHSAQGATRGKFDSNIYLISLAYGFILFFIIPSRVFHNLLTICLIFAA